jgi:hypothetical protein
MQNVGKTPPNGITKNAITEERAKAVKRKPVRVNTPNLVNKLRVTESTSMHKTRTKGRAIKSNDAEYCARSSPKNKSTVVEKPPIMIDITADNSTLIYIPNAPLRGK